MQIDWGYNIAISINCCITILATLVSKSAPQNQGSLLLIANLSLDSSILRQFKRDPLRTNVSTHNCSSRHCLSMHTKCAELNIFIDESVTILLCRNRTKGVCEKSIRGCRIILTVKMNVFSSRSSKDGISHSTGFCKNYPNCLNQNCVIQWPAVCHRISFCAAACVDLIVIICISFNRNKFFNFFTRRSRISFWTAIAM